MLATAKIFYTSFKEESFKNESGVVIPYYTANVLDENDKQFFLSVPKDKLEIIKSFPIHTDAVIEFSIGVYSGKVKFYLNSIKKA